MIVGLLFVFGGSSLVVLAFFTGFWTLIYGIPILIIGVVLLLNKKEDEIEMRKDLNKKKSKK